MARYILNSAVLTDYGRFCLAGPLTLEQARQFLDQGAESAIGHAGAAQLISAELQRPVEVQRQSVALAAGDQALVLRLLQRLPEGRVLDAAEASAWPHEYALLTRLE